MASYQPVAFNSPGYDYGSDVSQIERRRQMALALQKDALQPVEQQPVQPGQFATRTSPFQGLAKMAQMLAANRQQSKADDQQQSLALRSRKDLADILTRGQAAAAGTPDKTIMPDPQEAQQSADYGTPQVGPASVPGQKPNPMGAANIYMQHPMTAPMGMQLAQSEIADQSRGREMAQIMAMGKQPPGAASTGGTAAPAYGTPNFQPQGQQPQGQDRGIFDATPQQLSTMIQSNNKEIRDMAKLVMEQRKVTALRPGAPGVDQWGNVVTQPTPTMPPGMQLTLGGPNGPSASPVQGFAGAQAALNNIPNPSHGLIPIKTSSGQDIQLTQPEYLQWQQSGQLPQRLGGQTSQQQPPGTPQAATRPGGFHVPGAPGLGIIGAGQSQEDTVRQQAQLASNTEASKEFISEMRQNYAKLRDIPATIKNISRAKELAAGEAAQFMGPMGESKLALQKFFRANVPGMGNMNLEGVTKAEELQSSLFNQVMDNLKKMDASPSQYQQQVMQEAFGTLRTDPASLPKIMDVFEDILRNRVALHNETVGSAERRGTQFPYDVNVKLPAKKGQPLTAAEQQELIRLRQQVGR